MAQIASNSYGRQDRIMHRKTAALPAIPTSPPDNRGQFARRAFPTTPPIRTSVPVTPRRAMYPGGNARPFAVFC